MIDESRIQELVHSLDEAVLRERANDLERYYARRDSVVYGSGFLQITIDRQGREHVQRLHPHTVRLLSMDAALRRSENE